MKTRLPLLVLPLTLSVTLPARAAAPPAPAATVSGAPTGNRLAKSLAVAQPDKDGHVLLADFTVADARLADGLTLDAPLATYRQEEFFSDPTLRDQVEVVLTPAVVAGLRDLGIDDPLAHFRGRTLQVRGVRKETIYTGFPAYIVFTVTVDRLEDIKVTDRSAKPAPPSR